MNIMLPIASDNKDKQLNAIMLEKGIILTQYTTEEVLEMDSAYQELKVKKELAIKNDNVEELMEISKEIAKVTKTAILKKDKLNKSAKMKYEEQKKELGKYLPDITTEYATFGTLAKINEFLLQPENEGKEVLLFIDEINRSSVEVLQEVMNLILNRDINGFKLDPRVKLMAAANPSSSWSEFKDVDYQVTELDEAQRSRLTWLFVGIDEIGWINWASEFDEETGEQNIHEDIVEFISTFPDFLHVPSYKSSDDVSPNPRAYERVSKVYTTYLKNKSLFKSQSVLETLIYGDLGRSAGLAFIKFLNEKDNPMLKPAEIFATKEEELDEEVKERYMNEAPTRKIAILKNCMKYIGSKKKITNETALFVALINITEADVRVGVMQDILSNHKKLHKKLIAFDSYLDAFLDLDSLV